MDSMDREIIDSAVKHNMTSTYNDGLKDDMKVELVDNADTIVEPTLEAVIEHDEMFGSLFSAVGEMIGSLFD